MKLGKVPLELHRNLMRFHMKILNISPKDKIGNITILSIAKTKALSHVVADRRIQFTGKILRLPESRLVRIAFK